jgi:hypothetical protein
MRTMHPARIFAFYYPKDKHFFTHNLQFEPSVLSIFLPFMITKIIPDRINHWAALSSNITLFTYAHALSKT